MAHRRTKSLWRARVTARFIGLSFAVMAVVGEGTVAGAGSSAVTQEGAHVVERELLIVDKSAGQLVRLDLLSGEVTSRIDLGFGPHEVIAVSAEHSPTHGPLAVVSLYGTGPQPGSAIAVVDLLTGAVSEISLAPLTRPHGLAFVAGAGLVLVTAEAQNTLAVVDLATGGVVSHVAVGRGTPHMVVAHPDQAVGYVPSITGGSVTRVDLSTSELTTVAVGPGAEGIALATDGLTLWVGSNGNDSVYVLDAATLEQRAVVPTCKVPIRVTQVGAELMAATCMDDAVIQLFDAATYQLRASVLLPGGVGRPVGTLASSDGTRLYVATTADGRVHEIDVATAVVVRSFDVGVEPDGLAFRPGGE